ncbi:MAG TPA: PBP1A family penicillin-binding protein [Stellaceae bacterium]|nr:PBP1A family penicillin-binding protein [Stellaceae bacterium]
MIRRLRTLVRMVFMVSVMLALVTAGGAAWLVAHYGHDLPNQKELLTYVPPTGTKVYAADGTLITEFADQHRILTPFSKIPPLVIHAFLAAEDRDFYHHGGINPLSILRAAVADVVRYGRGERPLGASTITQQLVRHFLLTNEVSFARKIKEALLAYQIEQYLSKNRILEIYLNEIYLGAGSYGAAAASDAYFHKTLAELTPAEAALLAALPKAPHEYNPRRNPVAAKNRRDWVIGGMVDMGWLTPAQGSAAIAEPIRLAPPRPPDDSRDGYFVEDVRRELVARYGQKVVYEGGLIVRTSYTPADQTMAERAFRNGLIAYDRRHGWRGPIVRLGSASAAVAALATTPDPPGIGNWQLAAVVSADWNGAQIAIKGGGQGRIPLDELRWARRTLDNQQLGPPVARASEVLHPGDIVLVERLPGTAPTRSARWRSAETALPVYGLRQIPNVSGAIVVMEPSTGRVLAVVGGWDFRQSQFDRATQAWRQPGSSIKPFVYLTALQGDFTPSSIVEDAPIELPQGPGLPMWKPVNYEDTFVGPSTLRQALVHSRNLVTARLAAMIGMPAIAKTVEQFGIMDKMPLYYSMALGAGDTTVVRMTGAYAMLDNGGHWVLPSLIDMVQNRNGQILYQKGAAYCASCFVIAGPRSGSDAAAGFTASPLPPNTPSYLPNVTYGANPILYRPNKPDSLVDPITDYQIISMMEDVVQHGTGTAVAAVGKPLAGKTGTTNNWNDAWFVGFSPHLVAGVYVGFDQPRTLGRGEAGGRVAAPIFRDFMEAALANTPATPFKEPASADMVRVDDITGQPADAEDRNSILEAFRAGTGPDSYTGSEAGGEADGDAGADADADAAGGNGTMSAAEEQAYGDSGIPPGTVVPAPSAGNPGRGTGGLY